jgi:hypothetical protein
VYLGYKLEETIGTVHQLIEHTSLWTTLGCIKVSWISIEKDLMTVSIWSLVVKVTSVPQMFFTRGRDKKEGGKSGRN